MSSPVTDLRYTLRQLRRSPGFALTAVITLALGIGATTAMYSIVHSTLLAPLPYPHAEELVGLGFEQPGELPNNPQTGESADFIEAQAKSFASIGVADGGPLGANFSSGMGAAQSIHSLRVSSTYLPTLGIAPILGHTFTRDEDLPNAPPTVLLSENLWRRLLNADPNIFGKIVHINEDSYTVIGVMPSRFATVDSPDVWQPLHLSVDDPGYDGTNYAMIARLKPGASLGQALRSVIASFLYNTVDGLGRDAPASLLGNKTLAIAISAAAMLFAAIAASLILAQRAARLEPTEALRAE